MQNKLEKFHVIGSIKHIKLLPLLISILYAPLALSDKKFQILQGHKYLKEINQFSKHSYRINLKKNQFIAGDVLQKSVDIALEIVNPTGISIYTFDNFSTHKEPFHFTSLVEGDYHIHVKAKNQGQYSISLIKPENIAATNIERIQQMMVHYSPEQPGGVIAVVQSGKVVFSQAYGLANVEYGIPNTVDTPFQLASASKPFTAFALALLEEQNKLSFNDDIRKYIDWMPNFDEVITLRHLINHSSGLKDAFNLWEMSGGRHDDILSQQQLLAFIKNQKQLNFKPGERFQYNNGGYALLAEVVSKVTKQKFSSWMKSNIFDPLGMKSTLIMDDYQLIIKNRAYSYESEYLGLKNALLNKSNIGSVNVYSTVNDMALWFQNYRTLKLGNKKLFNNLWQPSQLNNGQTKNYSFGFFLKKYNGLKQVIQGGSTLFFKTMTNYYPKIDSGIIVLANTADMNVRDIALKTADIFFFNETKKNENKSDIIQVPALHVKPHADALTTDILLKQQQVPRLTDYTGSYYSEELATIYKITYENERLELSYHRGVYPLNPIAKDQFTLNNNWYMDWKFIFKRDKNGEIQHLTLDHSRAHNVLFERIKK